MTRQYDPRGRYFKHRQRRQPPREGFGLLAPAPPPPRDKDGWDNDDNLALLVAVLEDPALWQEMEVRKGGSKLCRRFGRSYHSLHTQLWKLAAGYRDRKDTYQPGDFRPPRRTRSGRFNGADRQLAEYAMTKGAVYGCDNARHLARVLLRKEAEVARWLKTIRTD